MCMGQKLSARHFQNLQDMPASSSSDFDISGLHYFNFFYLFI